MAFVWSGETEPFCKPDFKSNEHGQGGGGGENVPLRDFIGEGGIKRKGSNMKESSCNIGAQGIGFQEQNEQRRKKSRARS